MEDFPFNPRSETPKAQPKRSLFRDEDGDINTIGWIYAVAPIALIVIGLLMWLIPMYSVYSARKDGEALLAHAQSSKEVRVAEAKAKMESASYEAQADTIRAHGIANSNQIIGRSLEGNPAYLQWLFIDQLKDTKDQIIYIPSGNMGMPVLEANRLPQTQSK